MCLEGTEGRKGKGQGSRVLYTPWIIKLCRGTFGWGLFFFVTIYTRHLEYNNKVTVLRTGGKVVHTYTQKRKKVSKGRIKERRERNKNSWGCIFVDLVCWFFFFFLFCYHGHTRHPLCREAMKYLERVWNTHLDSRLAPGLRARWGSWWPPRRCQAAGWRATRRHRASTGVPAHRPWSPACAAAPRRTWGCWWRTGG